MYICLKTIYHLLSLREELDEVLQYRFDLSFLAMKEILGEERKFK